MQAPPALVVTLRLLDPIYQTGPGVVTLRGITTKHHSNQAG